MKPLAAGLCVLLAGCGTAPPPAPPRPPTVRSSPVPASAPVPPPTAPPGTPPSGTATTRASPTRSTGWTVTVYYTAVQRFHSGTPTAVTGCPGIDCAHGHADLGTYPADFVTAVRAEGTGHTSTGRYLNWSSDTGFWLDTAPRDSYGGVLQPFHSAAADPTVLPRGTTFTVTDCGRADGGDPVPAAVCVRLRGAHWAVVDEFTPGLGGAKHVDAYVGEETGPDFTRGDWYVTLTGAVLALHA
jgi:hypothetical protein